MFTELTSINYSQLRKYFIPQTHRLCYYSLSSFISWSHHISMPVWKIENDVLLVGMKYFSNPENNYLVLPIAQGKEYSPAQLYKFALSNGIKKYQFIPEDYVMGHNYADLESLFKIKEQTGFEDYIYNTSDLAELKGKKYSKKRNLINQFVKDYYNKGRVLIAPITSSDIDECLDFLEAWCSSRDFNYETNIYASTEKQTTINALKNINNLGLKGLLLKIDGKVQAFAMGSKLTEEIGGFHFEKAAPHIKGLYQFFDKQCARRLFGDYRYINKECDMGLEGLRQAKRSYYPVMRVKSYELFLK